MAKSIQQILEVFGNRDVIQGIVDQAHPDAVYYVNEQSRVTGKMGFYTDKLIVGVHNLHTHFKLDDLHKYLSIN